MGIIYTNKGVTVWMIAIVVFVIVLYYVYSGDNSGTVIAQFSAVSSILQEFSIHWKTRINDFLPLWVPLVPVSTYATYSSFGTIDAVFYLVSLLGLAAIAYIISQKRSRGVVREP